MRQRAADALGRLGASHLARRWLDEMSSGEARRVLLARALVTSPRALVLDEPTTGLDLVARHDFMERVRQIARDGTTLILITHHIDEIVPEIERVILLREGRIAAAGPKRSVLTADRLSDLFNAPIALEENDGYFYARAAGSSSKQSATKWPRAMPPTCFGSQGAWLVFFASDTNVEVKSAVYMQCQLCETPSIRHVPLRMPRPRAAA